MIGWIRRLFRRPPSEEADKMKQDAERRLAALRRDLARVQALRQARRGA